MMERAKNTKYCYWIIQKLMEGHLLSIQDVMGHTGFAYAQARVYLKNAQNALPVSTKRRGKTKIWYISDENLYSLTDKRREHE
jgi:hypothetical protein